MNAQLILTKNVNQFKSTFPQSAADGALHLCLGKVMMAAELGLITLKEMDQYIDLFFQQHFELLNDKK